MRIPTIRGLIDRRILVNYRVDPAVLARILPPLDVEDGSFADQRVGDQGAPSKIREVPLRFYRVDVRRQPRVDLAELVRERRAAPVAYPP